MSLMKLLVTCVRGDSQKFVDKRYKIYNIWSVCLKLQQVWVQLFVNRHWKFYKNSIKIDRTVSYFTTTSSPTCGSSERRMTSHDVNIGNFEYEFYARQPTAGVAPSIS